MWPQDVAASNQGAAAANGDSSSTSHVGSQNAAPNEIHPSSSASSSASHVGSQNAATNEIHPKGLAPSNQDATAANGPGGVSEKSTKERERDKEILNKHKQAAKAVNSQHWVANSKANRKEKTGAKIKKPKTATREAALPVHEALPENSVWTYLGYDEAWQTQMQQYLFQTYIEPPRETRNRFSLYRPMNFQIVGDAMTMHQHTGWTIVVPKRGEWRTAVDTTPVLEPGAKWHDWIAPGKPKPNGKGKGP